MKVPPPLYYTNFQMFITLVTKHTFGNLFVFVTYFNYLILQDFQDFIQAILEPNLQIVKI